MSKGKRVAITLRMPTFLSNKVRALAERDGMSINAWIERLLDANVGMERGLDDVGDHSRPSGLARPNEEWTVDAVATRVHKVIAEHLGCDPDKVVDGANLIDDLGADSLDQVELVMAFEEEFNVGVTDEELEEANPTTVRDVKRLLHTKLNLPVAGATEGA